MIMPLWRRFKIRRFSGVPQARDVIGCPPMPGRHRRPVRNAGYVILTETFVPGFCCSEMLLVNSMPVPLTAGFRRRPIGRDRYAASFARYA
jgi:hypothetical protein